MNYSNPNDILREFACRGMIVLSPNDLGIPLEAHTQLFEKQLSVFRAKQPTTSASVPEIADILNAPGLVNALDQLVGEGWAIVPFAHNAPFLSGAYDQHWHKDDNGPYNGRKHRHHQAIQVELLYYPQAVAEDMGPTATLPFSHYWTFNHEENHDNFAGADHLDFNYQLIGMEHQAVSGPKSEYDPADIVAKQTKHDIRMRTAATDIEWPLIETFEAGPLDAGSVIIYSHNLFHRGNHRRDNWQTWRDHPRFMWRFWLYRTHEPKNLAKPKPLTVPASDPMTGKSFEQIGSDIKTVWEYHYHWLQTAQPLSNPAESATTDALSQQLVTQHDKAEPERIGAAYRLAAQQDQPAALTILSNALQDEREAVRRAATYGLVAMGTQTTPTFIEAATSSVKWIRKAGIFGLGECGEITAAVLQTLGRALEQDASVYVRSVAAGAIGCFARRAMADGHTALIPECVVLLSRSLQVEENRLGMDRAQGRSIKFVRPTDECDVCEGMGIDFGLEQFEPVRSAVRENALWSLVILCSHPLAEYAVDLQKLTQTLQQVVEQDKNVINTGFALDALNRLAKFDDALRPTLETLLAKHPVRCWESLAPAGWDAQHVERFEQQDESCSTHAFNRK
ncbi:MAG: HEAT repeat domain-containing protein [Pseudomonadota bacterium]